MKALLVATIAIAATGCDMYWGGHNGGEDDVACPAAPAVSLRDPQNGACESLGDGCRGIPFPDWATCSSACDALDEATCRDSSGCRTIYTGVVCPPTADCKQATTVTFLACWATAPSGPAEGGDCWNDDVQECSRHDDCATVYTSQEVAGPLAQSLSFASCMPELRPLDPGTCDGQVLCRAAPPACPTGTVPGILNGCYSGYCIPDADCGPKDPGTCDAGGVRCNLAPPACPTGTEPGVKDGCWSGYCIPDAACS